MNTITSKRARRSPSVKQSDGEASKAMDVGGSEGQARAPAGQQQGTGIPLPELDPEHALERTLEALSVDHATAERIQKLPRDIGWLLVTAGLVGVVMPGVLGVPFLVLGGLILVPATHRRAERWLTGHSPKVFRGSIRQINRFLNDLERRYPRKLKE